MTDKRSDLEIAYRIGQVKDEDIIGFKREVLIPFLSYEQARPFIKSEVTAEQWAETSLCNATVEEIAEEARNYLAFAFGKAADHRGISASRSVDKLEEYAWLLGREDVLKAMGEADYENYGVPKLVAFARGMGFKDETEDNQELRRMSEGLPCCEGCEQGCGT